MFTIKFVEPNTKVGNVCVVINLRSRLMEMCKDVNASICGFSFKVQVYVEKTLVDASIGATFELTQVYRY